MERIVIAIPPATSTTSSHPSTSQLQHLNSITRCCPDSTEGSSPSFAHLFHRRLRSRRRRRRSGASQPSRLASSMTLSYLRAPRIFFHNHCHHQLPQLPQLPHPLPLPLPLPPTARCDPPLTVTTTAIYLLLSHLLSMVRPKREFGFIDFLISWLSLRLDQRALGEGTSASSHFTQWSEQAWVSSISLWVLQSNFSSASSLLAMASEKSWRVYHIEIGFIQ